MCRKNGHGHEFDVYHFMLLNARKNCMIYNNSSNHDAYKIKHYGGALSAYIPSLVYYKLLFVNWVFIYPMESFFSLSIHFSATFNLHKNLVIYSIIQRDNASLKTWKYQYLSQFLVDNNCYKITTC